MFAHLSKQAYTTFRIGVKYIVIGMNLNSDSNSELIGIGVLPLKVIGTDENLIGIFSYISVTFSITSCRFLTQIICLKKSVKYNMLHIIFVCHYVS